MSEQLDLIVKVSLSRPSGRITVTVTLERGVFSFDMSVDEFSFDMSADEAAQFVKVLQEAIHAGQAKP